MTITSATAPTAGVTPPAGRRWRALFGQVCTAGVFGLSLLSSNALAWSKHSYPSYRAFEKMPEVASAAPVPAEPLESFLRAEEKTLEAMLDSHEAWATANLESYPARPAALAFKAHPARNDEARKQAFLQALRIAPNSRFALFTLADPLASTSSAPPLPYASVNALPEPANFSDRYSAVKAGELLSPLVILASASEEPGFGLDALLWEDSPSEWGPKYGFGRIPFGNAAQPDSSSVPFHMGFMHESGMLYRAAPFIKRTFPRLRSYQYSSLAELAFRTGHPYWGWRFTGMAMHYVQDLCQPYRAKLGPGELTFKLLGANALASLGLGHFKEQLLALRANRHQIFEQYEVELMRSNAANHADTALERALRNADQDANYPEWSERYLVDVVSKQSAAAGERLMLALLASMPASYVQEADFDFLAQADNIKILNEVSKRDPAAKARLDSLLAELLGNWGAHSRNLVRGILKANRQP